VSPAALRAAVSTATVPRIAEPPLVTDRATAYRLEAAR
jgi:hypothetical protein